MAALSIKELAARLRRGELEDRALADYAAEYARAQRCFRNKKDD
ncbi:hypothetical protein [Gandjariella thermophila]|uniref:Uncharacterized protein n=1 Tax=Gandjariella thermophila TaxID=1931992 RepID=A0A4D4J0C2_9PSEU|nr:hypothetical protein [Gandjariella thermophila]GDY29901.1 hypothetical protein GTS_15340 [Gandjariella thermophila]